MKICPICRAQFENKAALAAHMQASHPRGQPRAGSSRKRITNQQPSSASIHLARSEYLGAFKQKNVKLQPGVMGARQLDAMAGVFELYRWEKLTFICKPTVGQATGGQCFIGFSYEDDHMPVTETDITCCQPSTSFPVSREGTLSGPVRLLMGQANLPTYAKTGEGSSGNSGYFNLKSDQSMGIWVSYAVTLSGPTAQSRQLDDLWSFSRKSGQWSDNNKQPVTELPAADSPLDVDVELDTGDEGVVNRAIDALKKWYPTLQELHRRIVDGLTYIHAYAGQAAPVAGVVLPVAAVVHRRQLLFRPNERLERSGHPDARGARGQT